jgi:hypothetical protein
MPKLLLCSVSKSAIKPKNMITAKELFDKMIEENDECTSTEMMIRFAKLHVIKALKKASEEATAGDSDGYYSSLIDKDSILKSYSLDGIV